VTPFDESFAPPDTATEVTEHNGHGTVPPGIYDEPPPKKRRWYKSGAVIVVAAILVVGGASVVADLPHHATRAQRIDTVDTVIRSVDTGIHPCTYAIDQAFTIYQRDASGTLDASQKAQVPGLVSQDAQACSFANQSVVNIATITIPGTTAGQHLSSVVKSVFEWMTSDAVGAMDDLESLISNPHDTSALDNLAKQERRLAGDRAAADRAMAAANRALGDAHVPAPALPKLPESSQAPS
jgi:hypothetical protein